MTADDLTEQRKAKDRARKEAQRHEAGAVSREAYLDNSLTKLKPWKAEGISRPKWYRRRRRETGCSAINIYKARNKLSHAPTKPNRPKLAKGNLCSPQNQNGKGQRMRKDPLRPHPSSTTEQPVSQEATAWCALPWASMTEAQVKAKMAAMERRTLRRDGQQHRGTAGQGSGRSGGTAARRDRQPLARIGASPRGYRIGV